MACEVDQHADFSGWLGKMGVNTEIALAMDTELGIRDYEVLLACAEDLQVRSELFCVARERLPFGFYAVLRRVVAAFPAERAGDCGAAASGRSCPGLGSLLEVLVSTLSSLSREFLRSADKLNALDARTPASEDDTAMDDAAQEDQPLEAFSQSNSPQMPRDSPPIFVQTGDGVWKELKMENEGKYTGYKDVQWVEGSDEESQEQQSHKEEDTNEVKVEMGMEDKPCDKSWVPNEKGDDALTSRRSQDATTANNEDNSHHHPPPQPPLLPQQQHQCDLPLDDEKASCYEEVNKYGDINSYGAIDAYGITQSDNYDDDDDDDDDQPRGGVATASEKSSRGYGLGRKPSDDLDALSSTERFRSRRRASASAGSSKGVPGGRGKGRSGGGNADPLSNGLPPFALPAYLSEVATKAGFPQPQWTYDESAERPFACHACGRAFRSKQKLRVHFRTHTGEKPYGCEECGKRFTRSDHLLNHRRMHSGQKPFLCDICGKAFMFPYAVTQHKRTQHCVP
ncbi:zinc finger and SCAN domain-containing protein 29-like isoform X1 [Lethenteron reissneri]|uniref:zinc finger and SCAN domain-containing protein 29-like isoform X1 n=1 Tax=Lethenteron reissneri TaxID=7753 RepID=UPI002AB6D84A|nr:zinc finger and SCAN domain-containing protein 29-like isoform X1 [Lethenteron reissneri]